jgi:hypothetical protein
MTDISSHPLWQHTEREFLRAERLIERAVEQLQAQGLQHQQERARVGLDLERALAPIQSLSAGLQQVIETMAQQRQENRLQRWQGELQNLLMPVDEAEHQLQELLLQLEQPTPDHWQGQPLAEARPAIQRLQLQQLLSQRQRQVQQLQAELKELRLRCWTLETSGSAGSPQPEPDGLQGESESGPPAIFG